MIAFLPRSSLAFYKLLETRDAVHLRDIFTFRTIVGSTTRRTFAEIALRIDFEAL